MRTSPLRAFINTGKVDLTKKEGFGPRAKETDTTKFEMGNPLGIENPVALEKVYEKTENKKPRQ